MRLFSRHLAGWFIGLSCGMGCAVAGAELPAGDEGLPFEGGRWIRVSTSCGESRVSDQQIALFTRQEDPRLSIRAWAEFVDRRFEVALLSEAECDRDAITSDFQPRLCGDDLPPEDVNSGHYSFSASERRLFLNASRGVHRWGTVIRSVTFEFVGPVLVLRAENAGCLGGDPWFSYWVRFPDA